VSTLILFTLVALACSMNSLADQSRSYPFSIESEKQGDDGHRIVARNNGPAPISVMVSLAESRNIKADRPFPVFAVVPPRGGILHLAHLRPAMTGTGYSFGTRSSWMLGDFNARQSSDAMYRLPYRDGMAFRIGQAPGGPVSTHITPESEHAVDITMPEGTPVLAARGGLVIDTEASQVHVAQTPDMMAKANMVRIQHVDGTIAVYAHLAPGGVQVYPGQRVATGTQIGLAGSTGYSSGPHLHFAVQTVVRTGDGLTMVSLPFVFYVGDPPKVFAPRSGMLASADYSSEARVPAVQATAEVAAGVRPAQEAVAAAGNRGTNVSPQVLAGIRSRLLDIPVWQWAGIMIAVFFLLILLDRVRRIWRRQPPSVVPRPAMRSRSAPEPVSHRLSSRDRLVVACGGDRQRAERLQEYEYRRAPRISDEEAAQRAWERLQRERH